MNPVEFSRRAAALRDRPDVLALAREDPAAYWRLLDVLHGGADSADEIEEPARSLIDDAGLLPWVANDVLRPRLAEAWARRQKIVEALDGLTVGHALRAMDGVWISRTVDGYVVADDPEPYVSSEGAADALDYIR